MPYEQSRRYANRVDMIVCSGGDGTLDEVVTGISEVNARLPLGYIPAGSTNDFANSLFIPRNMVKAAEVIMEGHLYRCDIGKFNDSIFAYCGGFRTVHGCVLPDGSGSEKCAGPCGLCAGRREAEFLILRRAI